LDHLIDSYYYDPKTGRFVNADRVAVFDETKTDINGLNLYAYCANNPMMFVDPTGQIWDWFDNTFIQPIGNAIDSAVGWVSDNALTIVLIVGIVALTIATGGVGGIVFGFILGATPGAGMSIISQGFENGFDNINWVDVGISALMGGAFGALTGGVGGAIAGRTTAASMRKMTAHKKGWRARNMSRKKLNLYRTVTLLRQ